MDLINERAGWDLLHFWPVDFFPFNATRTQERSRSHCCSPVAIVVGAFKFRSGASASSLAAVVRLLRNKNLN